MSKISKSKASLMGLIIAILFILGGSYSANKIQTYGDIKVKDLKFLGSDGKLISALLYIPPEVSKSNPAPGIVAIHGYALSKETQSPFSIEYARRGFVVLAPDMTGHGYSDPPAYSNVFGGLDALTYLRSLDIVDSENIGLEGVAMGGWAALFAADIIPDGYQSVFLISSSTGTFGVPDGSVDFPHNLAIVSPKYDEFSDTLWETPIAAEVPDSGKIKNIFGVTDRVRIGSLYGSYDDMNARILYQPELTHSQANFSREVVENAIDWMQATLKGGKFLNPSNQIWYWKEVGTMIALSGMVLLLFSLGHRLLLGYYFNSLVEPPEDCKSLPILPWLLNLGLMVAIPTFFYGGVWRVFENRGNSHTSYVWPQQTTTLFMAWFFLTSICLCSGFIFWHLLINRKKGATPQTYGINWKDLPVRGLDFIKIYKSFLLSVLITAGAYFSLAVCVWAFNIDFRCWIFSVKLMSIQHFWIMLRYLPTLMIYFFVIGMILHGQMRKVRSNGSSWKMWQEMGLNIFLLLAPIMVMLFVQYRPLFLGKTLFFPELDLASIFLFQFIPIGIITAMVSTYFFRKTGHIYVGAFTNTLLVAWILVASQPIHYA